MFAAAKLGRADGSPDEHAIGGGGNREHAVIGQPVFIVEFFSASALPVNDTAVTRADPEVSFAAGKRRHGDVSKTRMERRDRFAVIGEDAAFRKTDQKNAGRQHE